MVGVARIELATPAMSTQCSTTELHAHSGGDVEALVVPRKALIDPLCTPRAMCGRSAAISSKSRALGRLSSGLEPTGS